MTGDSTEIATRTIAASDGPGILAKGKEGSNIPDMRNPDDYLDSFLSSFSRTQRTGFTRGETSLPKMKDIETLEEQFMMLFFPGHQGTGSIESLSKAVRYNLEKTARLLSDSIRLSVRYENPEMGEGEAARISDEHVEALLDNLGAIRKMLKKDAEAGFEGDPAARNVHEVILCYPSMRALTVHRVASFMFQRGVPLVPRMMSEIIHSKTGIDIHPGARIGESFFIDHGTGVVIGETTVIGDHVKLYQGVTLGALSIPKQGCGQLLVGAKRHPTIEDNVTIYANATILGDVTIGHDSTIASNAWIKESIPPESLVITQTPEIKVRPKKRLPQ